MKHLGGHSPIPLQRSACFSNISHSNSPRLPKFSPNISECCLTRPDILSLDRSKLTLNLLNKRRSKDISFFYENIKSPTFLSGIKDLSACTLPTSLATLRNFIDSYGFRSENLLAKGQLPSSRKEAESLADWLEEMQNHYLPGLNTILENNLILDKEITDTIEVIFVAAFKEGIKQTSSSCLPRAMMMLKVFETLSFIWKKSNSTVNKIVDELNTKKNKELKKISNEYEEIIKDLNKVIEDMSKSFERVSKTKDLLENETTILKKHLIRVQQGPERRIEKTPTLLLKKLNNQKHVYVQTDEIESESSQDSSSEEEINVPQVCSSDKILSRQNTKLMEKKTEQILLLKTKLQNYGCDQSFDSEELHNYISKEFCDFYAWIDGFRICHEYLQSSFSKKPEENSVQSLPIAHPITSVQHPIRSEEKRRSMKDSRLSTFKFRNNLTIAQHITENSPIEYILDHLANQSSYKIKKLTNMTYNKLSMQISNYFNLCLIKGPENFESFAIFVYTELFQKYSIKQFANRKFKSLAACCIKHSSSAKAQVFLRMLGGGKCIALSSFNHFECKLVIKLYEFMFNDKTGILTESGSTETIYYPTIRALECVKQQFENLIPRGQISKLCKSIEEMSKTDPDLINSKGLIDIHAFVLASVQSYQDYLREIFDSVKLAAKSLNEEESYTIGEIHLLIRNISKAKTIKTLPFDANNLIDLDEFCEFCLNKSVLRPEEISNFFSSPAEINIAKVQDTKEEISAVLSKIEGLTTLSLDEWESKLDDVVLWFKAKKTEKAENLWTLLSSEFRYLTSSLEVNNVN